MKKLLEILLNKDDKTGVSYFGQDGSETKLEQIAVVFKDNNTYLIARISGRDGEINGNEVLVFGVDESDGRGDRLIYIDNAETAQEVFDIYCNYLNKLKT